MTRHWHIELELDPEARRLAREGCGWEDVRYKLGMSERDARTIVFGKSWVAEWERRMKAREAS
mgnify:FL=1